MYSLTLDFDWVPDWMVADIVSKLIDYQLKATFFVTNPLPTLELIRQHDDLFELGIHPNLFPGSTQGNSIEAVMEYGMKLVPEAVSMRTHGLFQNTKFLFKACEYGIKNDVSLFVPNLEVLSPHILRYHSRELRRIPYNWEDDFAMFNPGNTWSWEELLNDGNDYILDFHPIHIALNSNDLSSYSRLKKDYPDFGQWSSEKIMAYQNAGKGTATFFDECCAYLTNVDNLMTISEIMTEPEK